MTRVLSVLLTCVVLAAAVAWYQRDEPEDSIGVTDASAVHGRDEAPVTSAAPNTRRETSGGLATPTVAEAREAPHPRGNQPAAGAGNPMVDPATGAVPASWVPEDDPVVSSSVGVPPVDSEVDPATGATIARRAADDGTAATSVTGLPPGDFEVDPATGAATAR